MHVLSYICIHVYINAHTCSCFLMLLPCFPRRYLNIPGSLGKPQKSSERLGLVQRKLASRTDKHMRAPFQWGL